MESGLFWDLLNLGSFGLSVYAIFAAVSAKKAAKEAAEKVVERKNWQEDSERLRNRIDALSTAKEAALRRQRGAPAILSAGKDPALDLHLLRIAHDNLVTWAPDIQLEVLQLQGASDELLKAIGNIEHRGQRDGWRDALATLQILIPALTREERRQRDQGLLDHVRERE
jgi:hypothetical protein